MSSNRRPWWWDDMGRAVEEEEDKVAVLNRCLDLFSECSMVSLRSRFSVFSFFSFSFVLCVNWTTPADLSDGRYTVALSSRCSLVAIATVLFVLLRTCISIRSFSLTNGTFIFFSFSFSSSFLSFFVFWPMLSSPAAFVLISNY